jgi:hypothetical protein
MACFNRFLMTSSYSAYVFPLSFHGKVYIVSRFVCMLAWASSSASHPPEKRAVALAFMNCLSQLGNVVGSCVLPLSFHRRVTDTAPGITGQQLGVQATRNRICSASLRARLASPLAFDSGNIWSGSTCSRRRKRGGTAWSRGTVTCYE